MKYVFGLTWNFLCLLCFMQDNFSSSLCLLFQHIRLLFLLVALSVQRKQFSMSLYDITLLIQKFRNIRCCHYIRNSLIPLKSFTVNSDTGENHLRITGVNYSVSYITNLWKWSVYQQLYGGDCNKGWMFMVFLCTVTAMEYHGEYKAKLQCSGTR